MRAAHWFGCAFTASVVAAAAGQPFTQGNLVVLQAGDGSAALTNAATAVFLKEIRISDGAVIQTIPLPTTPATSGNRAVTITGTSTTDGALTRSTDKRYLLAAGFNAAPGTAGPGTPATAIGVTLGADVNRVVARIDANGAVDSTTAFSDDTYGGNGTTGAGVIRGATSTNGTDIWLSGDAPSVNNRGVRYATFGSASSLQLSTTVTNMRVVNVFNDQLYVSSMSGAFRGVCSVGTGLPTTGGQTITLLPGFDPSTTSPQDTEDFFYADANTLYVAEQRTSATPTAGLQKWTFDGALWTLQYTLTSGLTALQIRHVTGTPNAGGNVLFATTGDSSTTGNKLVTVTDTGAASSFSVIANAPVNTLWKGVDFTPEGSVAPSCYANCDASTSPPCLNVNDFTCFLNSYSAGAAYANCDASTLAPVLNVNDFTCFLNKYSAGCTNPCTAP